MTEQVFKHLQDSLGRDMLAFAPELLLCAGIVVLLLSRLVPYLDRNHLGWVSLVITAGALILAWMQWQREPGYDPRHGTGMAALDLFTGLLIYDSFAIFIKMFLFAFAALLGFLSLLTGIPDREDSADFHVLLLGATVGMSLMASSNHLLMVFIGVEMASLPSYALAGVLKGRRRRSEACL